jgi:hypothetical protein
MKTLKEIKSAIQQQLEEGVVVSADYKVSPETGRKVRAHRRKMGNSTDEFQIDPEKEDDNLPKPKKAKFDKFYEITKVVDLEDDNEKT